MGEARHLTDTLRYLDLNTRILAQVEVRILNEMSGLMSWRAP
jgi:hypothetical protein